MAEQKLEFDFEMACEGCYNAAKRVLAKIGVEQVEGDIPNHKLWVTSMTSCRSVRVGSKVYLCGMNNTIGHPDNDTQLGICQL
ncbi:hypothetical protein LSAT2_029654 [Lamellibrachia satsuma]|nr:hypothetical protein LSAT2_029654 [Lamellibrachia satsuma]